MVKFESKKQGSWISFATPFGKRKLICIIRCGCAPPYPKRIHAILPVLEILMDCLTFNRKIILIVKMWLKSCDSCT